jgi:plastocyanin
VAWAVIVSAAGIRSSRFPTSASQGRLVIATTAVLVLFAASMAVLTAKTPPGAPPYTTSAVTDGVAPTVTPVSAAATNGPLALAANPKGELAFNTTTLVAASSHVTIDFTNKSPLEHNVTIANAKGKVLGATPTFKGGERTLTLDLPAGTYTFYCSVPGHEQAGMKGTLTVRSTGAAAPAPPKPANGALELAASPKGELAFNTTTLVAASSHVTIDFTNKSPLQHNVTIANAKGKVLGATPTFIGGTKTLTLDLPPGTYTYYCSVPGHEEAGMKGTLTVH